MNDETIDHLRIAEANRDLALTLLHPSAGSVRPRRWEWVGVVAFYAAVHYVSAYLWERRQFAPSSHAERGRLFLSDSILYPLRRRYRVLQVYGYEARYEVDFAATEANARELIDNDLRAVEAAVLRALGMSVSTWQLPDPV